MAYTKNTWATGDIVTSAKLNHMEDGIASGAVMVVRVNSTTDGNNIVYILDKTWQEIYDAIDSGLFCFLLEGGERSFYQYGIDGVEVVDGVYYVNSNIRTYQTDVAGGYPQFIDRDGQ